MLTSTFKPSAANYTHYIETELGEEIELTVYFDFQPEEKMTWDYPGCPADAEVTEVLIAGTSIEVCLMPDEEASVVESILDSSYHRDYRNFS